MKTEGRRRISIAISIVWVAWLLAQIFPLLQSFEAPHWPPALRMLSSFTLVLLAWGGSFRGFRKIAWGMTFGFLGDLCLSGIFFSTPAGLPWGMLLFAVGHVFYLRACLQVATKIQKPIPFFRAWLGVLALTTLFWCLIIEKKPEWMRWASLGYAGLLSATAGGTAALARVERQFLLPFVGGLFFLISDSILSLELFEPQYFALLPSRWQKELVWITYMIAQGLIIYGFGRAKVVTESSSQLTEVR